MPEWVTHTHLADSVVPWVVEVVGGHGPGDTRGGIHLLLLLVQHHLTASDTVHIWVGHRGKAKADRTRAEFSESGLFSRVSYLQVLDHDGVLDFLGLQVDFGWLQAVEGDSDVHGGHRLSHAPPEVQLKENTGVTQQIRYNCTSVYSLTRRVFYLKNWFKMIEKRLLLVGSFGLSIYFALFCL